MNLQMYVRKESENWKQTYLVNTSYTWSAGLDVEFQ